MAIHDRSANLLSLLLIATMVLASGQNSSAQSPGSPPDRICPVDLENPGPLSLGRTLTGLSPTAVNVDCRTCHGVAKENQRESDGWIIQNEFQVWRQKDRHSQAYLTLLGERSQRMGKILGVADIAKDPRCLACHATVPAEWMANDPTTVERLLSDSRHDSLVKDGVGCEACHGAFDSADGAIGWREAHTNSDAWRNRTPSTKQDEFGFYDIRSPSSRTRMCVSCHVGDPGRGRLVTHEMYAAGHPPLPAFEMETFLRDMPPHWRVLGTKDDAIPQRDDDLIRKPAVVSRKFLAETQDPYFANVRAQDAELFERMNQDFSSTFDRTRSLAVSAIVTWAQSARVTAALTTDKEFPLIPAENRWPELANFECSACHHDLKLEGWRANRQPPTTPGRPLLRDWSSPLFIAVCQAFNSGETPQSIQAIEDFRNSATLVHPFGDRKEINEKLIRVADQADALAKKIELKPFSTEQASNLLRSIVKLGSEGYLDYESGRHMVWALDEICRELAEVDSENDWNAVANQIEQMKKLFVTDLATSDVRQDAVSLGGSEQLVELINLREVLKPMESYDARELNEHFKQLQKSLSN